MMTRTGTTADARASRTRDGWRTTWTQARVGVPAVMVMSNPATGIRYRTPTFSEMPAWTAQEGFTRDLRRRHSPATP